MYKPTKTNKRKIGSPTRPPKAGTTAADRRLQERGRKTNRDKADIARDLRKTADELRGGINPALRRIKKRKDRLENEGPGHMGMGFAGGGKIKTKGYALGGAAKGGKKFKPPCSTNTGLYGK
tara:strand:+ start:122 stop:487 length:366 start_codon:yes stop_codon:yes gene_type:complete